MNKPQKLFTRLQRIKLRQNFPDYSIMLELRRHDQLVSVHNDKFALVLAIEIALMCCLVIVLLEYINKLISMIDCFSL